MCQFINEQPYVYASLGVAAFGPLNLDQNSETYGYVTTTPKVAW